jgi:hypothetical protein
MYPIATSGVLTGSTNSVTFSSIPSQYKHLQIRLYTRLTGASSLQSNLIYFNGDSAANYASHRLFTTGLVGASQGFSAQNFVIASGIPAANDLANVFGATIIDIDDANSATRFKTMKIFSGASCNTGNGEAHMQSGLWRSNNAITSVLIASGTGNFAQNSRIDLYGIQVATATGA